MKILVYFGHPAQYLFLRKSIKDLLAGDSNKIIVTIKTKDVLEQLLIADGIPYINILKKERGNSKLGIFFSLIKRILKLLPIILKNKPDLLISTDASIAQVGFLLRIKRITITEDDYDVIKTLAKLTYPFTNTILCPNVCNVGKWDTKKIGYNGYMKLGYLHPLVFNPNIEILKKYNFSSKYTLIRLAKLTAHHDFGISGINLNTLDKIIEILEAHGFEIHITAEGKIHEKYNKYLLKINSSHIHHILAGSSLLICDSQSMSVEAAMLGIPSIRVSDFSGRISVLEELEKKYDLTYGIKPFEEEKIINKLKELLAYPNLSQEFQKRKVKMLNDKINVSDFITWFIQNYPKSIKTLKDNPEFQNNFKIT